MRYLSLILTLFLTGCEGFKISGQMCESLQPGQSTSAACRPYSEEEAQKASETKKEDSGECLKCKEAQRLELRQ